MEKEFGQSGPIRDIFVCAGPRISIALPGREAQRGLTEGRLLCSMKLVTLMV